VLGGTALLRVRGRPGGRPSRSIVVAWSYSAGRFLSGPRFTRRAPPPHRPVVHITDAQDRLLAATFNPGRQAGAPNALLCRRPCFIRGSPADQQQAWASSARSSRSTPPLSRPDKPRPTSSSKPVNSTRPGPYSRARGLLIPDSIPSSAPRLHATAARTKRRSPALGTRA